MIFVIGMWIYLVSMFIYSEDESIETALEALSVIGIFTMCISVSMFLWEKLP